MRRIKKLSFLIYTLFVLGIGCSAPSPQKTNEPVISLKIQKIADGLHSPVAAAFTPDGTMLIAQQTGQIRVLKGKDLLEVAFLDLQNNAYNPQKNSVLIADTPHRFCTLSIDSSNNPISKIDLNRVGLSEGIESMQTGGYNRFNGYTFGWGFMPIKDYDIDISIFEFMRNDSNNKHLYTILNKYTIFI